MSKDGSVVTAVHLIIQIIVMILEGVDWPLSRYCNDKGTRSCTGWTQNRLSRLFSTAAAWPPRMSWTQRATGRSPRTRTWRNRTGTAAHIGAVGTSSSDRKIVSRSCQVWQYERAQAWRHPLSWKKSVKLIAGKCHGNIWSWSDTHAVSVFKRYQWGSKDCCRDFDETEEHKQFCEGTRSFFSC